MMSVNTLLEVTNGVWTILTFCALVVLTIYLVDGWRRNELNWRDLVSLPLAMALALSMHIQNAGTFISRGTIWFWRATTHGKIPLNDTYQVMLIIGAAVAAAGILLSIRLLSRPRFGDMPWMLSAGLVVLYVVAYVSFAS